MIVGLDTNVLVYAEGIDGDESRLAARSVIGRLTRGQLVIPVQCLGELYRVLTGRAGWRPAAAARALDDWRALATTAPTTEETLESATALVAAHPHQIWDAIILSACAGAGCRMLLSEDMQDGFVYRGMTVVNPFAATPHPLLASYLEASP